MRGVFIVAKVAISRASYSFDALYSYSVPEELAQKVKSGVRVLVPFGRGNRKAVGFVARTYTEAEYNDKLKPVISVVDGESLVTEEMMRIIMWLKENTFCTYYDAYKSVVPTGFSYTFSQHYSLVNTYIDEDTLNEDEKNVVDFLRCAKSQREIDSFLDVHNDARKKKTVDSLVDKGYVEISDALKRKVGDENVSMVRLSDEYVSGEIQTTLTPKQTLVVKLLEEGGCASVKEVCYKTNCTSSILKRLAD